MYHPGGQFSRPIWDEIERLGDEKKNSATAMAIAECMSMERYEYYRTVPIALWQTKIVYNKFTSAIDTVMDLYNLGLFYKI